MPFSGLHQTPAREHAHEKYFSLVAGRRNLRRDVAGVVRRAMPAETEQVEGFVNDVPSAYIYATLQHGVRTQVPDVYGWRAWRHKYMLHGVHVITKPFSKDVVAAHWAVTNELQVAECERRFSSLGVVPAV